MIIFFCFTGSERCDEQLLSNDQKLDIIEECVSSQLVFFILYIKSP